MDTASRYVSLVPVAGTWIWDAWAKAHDIPYPIEPWQQDIIKGVLLAPFGKWVIDKTVDDLKKILKKKDQA